MGTQQSSAPTHDLVERSRAGDREAFGRVIERFRPRLEAVIHFRLGVGLRAEVDPEDVFQETCYQALRSLDSFEWRGEAAFFRWLGRIAENVIRNLVRYARNHPTVPLSEGLSSSRGGEGAPAPIASSVSPLERERQTQRFDRLEAALGKLKEDYREVVILARIRGLPIKEIAEKFGKTRDATSMLLLRALRQLKSHFGSTVSFSLPARSLDYPPEE